MHLNTETTAAGFVCTFPRASNIAIPDHLKESPAGRIACTFANGLPIWTAEPAYGTMASTRFVSLEAAEFYLLAAATEYLCQRATSA